MRRPLKKRRVIDPDPLYKSEKVARLINVILLSGKKNIARKAVYDALAEIKKGGEEGNDPLVVFEAAITNVSPTVEVRSQRVGGANYQIPREVGTERRLALALRWIVEAARAAKKGPLFKRLANELIAASKEEGVAFTKRENTHKMVEANKAFAYLAR